MDFRCVPNDIAGELQRAKVCQSPYVGVYQKLRSTGCASIHDAETLCRVNTEHDYREQAEDFLNSLPDPDEPDSSDGMPGKGDH